MTDSDGLPLLRHVDVFPIDMDDRQMICLRDPDGYSAEPVLLSPEAFYLASLLDGSHDVRDIQAACMQKFGQLVYSETVEDVITALDEAYML